MQATEKRTKVGERLGLLARIRIDRDVESLNVIQSKIYSGVPPSVSVKKWDEILTGVQLEQLGCEWIRRIEVDAEHPPRRLEVLRRCKQEMDPDNFMGGLKPLIDALKSKPIRFEGHVVGRRPGWFFDDSSKYVTVHPLQLVTGEKAWLEITLYGRTGTEKS